MCSSVCAYSVKIQKFAKMYVDPTAVFFARLSEKRLPILSNLPHSVTRQNLKKGVNANLSQDLLIQGQMSVSL